MQKSLPSYEHIKEKYKNGQSLSPIEIGRGLVFLLIEELVDDILPNNPSAAKANQECGEFYSGMLQKLTELSKHHLDCYDMVYYNTIMVCCIRCLVNENKYCVETLSTNINNSTYARQKLEQIDFIDETISEIDDEKICLALNRVKNHFVKTVAEYKNEAEYKDISLNILLHMSAINMFAEIISLHWDMPELLYLFYSSSKKASYNSWIKSALDDVNKHIVTEPKIKLAQVKISPNNAKNISQLFNGRYLDISRLHAYLRALKEGTGLTISGGSDL